MAPEVLNWLQPQVSEEEYLELAGKRSARKNKDSPNANQSSIPINLLSFLAVSADNFGSNFRGILTHFKKV